MAHPYHHGDLRAALLRAAVAAIAEQGAASMSLRDVARRAEVTHTAAGYHFGNKAGLLTAVAADGYRLLGDVLSAAQEEHESFLEIGVSYVQFAVDHPAHFEVMFQPNLYHADDPDLVAAKQATAELLYGTDDADTSQLASGVAAWALVHGLATLWLNGNIPDGLGDDPEPIARVVGRHLRVERPGEGVSRA
jgi:AcrR family transcriptional regulator